MKFKLRLKKKFDLGKIDLDLHKEINDIAGMIVEDHKKRLEYGQDIKGKPFKKLKPDTIKQKRRKGYRKPRQPLIATGTMQKFPPFKKATASSQMATIKPAQSRMKIGAYHNVGGRKNLPKREWYGITDKIADKAWKFMLREIDRRLERA